MKNYFLLLKVIYEYEDFLTFYLFKIVLNNLLPTFHLFSLPFRIRLIENIHESLRGSLIQADMLPLRLLHASLEDTFLFQKRISPLDLNLIISLQHQYKLLVFF